MGEKKIILLSRLREENSGVWKCESSHTPVVAGREESRWEHPAPMTLSQCRSIFKNLVRKVADTTSALRPRAMVFTGTPILNRARFAPCEGPTGTCCWTGARARSPGVGTSARASTPNSPRQPADSRPLVWGKVSRTESLILNWKLSTFEWFEKPKKEVEKWGWYRKTKGSLNDRGMLGKNVRGGKMTKSRLLTKLMSFVARLIDRLQSVPSKTLVKRGQIHEQVT
jgi:hypothetical protein